MPTSNTKDTAVVNQLQSKGHGELLDAIDRLRHDKIDGDISIPQIVVCGDQSSGKSSVLEAIAGVPFPKGIGTKTTFATEVILRNSAQDEAPKVRIRPDPGRWTDEERMSIEGWTVDPPITTTEDVETAVEKAQKFLKSIDEKREFWYDRLEITLSGRGQPHLTLIDLPGLIHNDGEQGKTKDKIRHLSREYIESKHAVILAVMDAPNDLERHGVMELLRKSNGQSRAMGIITKPDVLSTQTDDDKQSQRWLKMIREKTPELGLGWHVLCNSPTMVDRDERERQFFKSNLLWSRLPDDCKGAPNLRRKLSGELLARIQMDLPRLIERMTSELSSRNKTLDQLGDSRETEKEKFAYLLKLSEDLTSIIQPNLDGGELKDHAATSLSGRKRLRNIINGHTDSFAKAMREKGQMYHINQAQTKSYPKMPDNAALSFSVPPTRRYSVTFDRYVTALASYIAENRGTNMAWIPPPGTYKVIFRLQSKLWPTLVRECTKSCEYATREFLEQICKHIAAEEGSRKLLDHLIMPKLQERAQRLDEKVDELLWPYLYSHPIICDNSEFASSYDEGSWESYLPKNPTDHERAAAAAMDSADKYYELAMRTLIENVATLAVERTLLHDLESLVSPTTMHGLDVDTINNIANEEPSTIHSRRKCQTQKETLVAVLEICSYHNRHQAQSDSSDSTKSKSDETPPSDDSGEETPNSSMSSVGRSQRAGKWSTMTEAEQSSPKTKSALSTSASLTEPLTPTTKQGEAVTVPKSNTSATTPPKRSSKKPVVKLPPKIVAGSGSPLEPQNSSMGAAEAPAFNSNEDTASSCRVFGSPAPSKKSISLVHRSRSGTSPFGPAWSPQPTYIQPSLPVTFGFGAPTTGEKNVLFTFGSSDRTESSNMFKSKESGSYGSSKSEDGPKRQRVGKPDPQRDEAHSYDDGHDMGSESQCN